MPEDDSLKKVRRKMDLLSDDDPLHSLMEDTATKAELLNTLHRDLADVKETYLSFSRRMLLLMTVVAVISIAALAIAVSLLSDVKSAQRHSDSAVAATSLQAAQNAVLISRLDTLANLAQEQGARADIVQCRQINRLKSAITRVIRSSPQGHSSAADRAAAEFKISRCTDLPNAKPVIP